MLRDKLIDTAIRLGVDVQLRSLRAMVLPTYRHDHAETGNLRKLLQSALKEDSNCIDIGAYRGRMLAEILRVAPRGKHIAYEPLPHLHQQLIERFPSVDVRLAAVSNEETETTFTYVKNMPAESGFRERPNTGKLTGRRQFETIHVRTETLDHSLPADYVPALIKIDVEGAERQVFEGAIETITKHKPVVLFEHGKGGAVHYDTQPRQIYELLHNEMGMRIFDLDGNGPYTLSQFEEAFMQDERWDYVARP